MTAACPDAVIITGFIESHAHMMAGAMWRYAYAGYHDRVEPDGKLWRGLTDIETVIAGLTDYAKGLGADEPLVDWGIDPIFLTCVRLSAKHLDQISSTRPIAIIFSNFHLMSVNSLALEMTGYDATTNAEGVIKGADGAPTGELQEMAVMFPIMRRLGIDFRGLRQEPASIRSYGQLCRDGPKSHALGGQIHPESAYGGGETDGGNSQPRHPNAYPRQRRRGGRGLP